MLQVKKLVYVYLVRYAEEQQDLALLSISTFQRGLKVCVHSQKPSYLQLIKMVLLSRLCQVAGHICEIEAVDQTMITY